MYIVIIYLIAINITSFIIYGIDKYKARNNKRRVSEKALLTLAYIGGLLGAITGMIIFRHKTSKTSFISKISLITFAYLAALYYIMKTK